MKVLDAKKKLNEETYHEFFKYVTDEIIVSYLEGGLQIPATLTYTKDSFTNDFFSKKNIQLFDDDQDICISTDSVTMTIGKADLMKYCDLHKTNHRKLVDAEQYYETPEFKEDKINNKVTYYRSIAVCKAVGNTLTGFEKAVIITAQEDVMKQMNFWLNKYFREADAGTIRFNLKYKDGDEKFPYKWKSIKELVDDGVITLKS